jgi:hypothetical protein
MNTKESGNAASRRDRRSQPVGLIYQQYVDYLKTKQSNRAVGYGLKSGQQTEKFEKHRILPGHAGGTYTASNILYLTFQEHKLAHFYRYLSFQEKG